MLILTSIAYTLDATILPASPGGVQVLAGWHIPSSLPCPWQGQQQSYGDGGGEDGWIAMMVKWRAMLIVSFTDLLPP